MTGIELIKQVKEKALYKKVPAIMMTSDADRNEVVKAAEVGITGYILKPFSGEILEEKIVEVLCELISKSLFNSG